MPLTRVYHAQKPSFWQRQHANLAYCREPNLIFALLTAQRIFAIKTRRTKPPATISQDYLLGGCAFGASGILFIAEATATRKSCVLPRAKLVFCFANRAENLCYQNKTDKTSCRNFARLSAWWVRLWRKRNIVHRRGNGNTQILRVAESQTCFLLFYRAPLLKRHYGEINRSQCHSEK